MNKSLPILAVLLSCAALATAVFNPNSSPGSNDAPVSASSDQAALTELKNEIAQLKTANAALKAQLAEMNSKPLRIVDNTIEVEALRKRVAKLENTQIEVIEAVNETDKYGVVAAMEKEIVSAYTTLMDAQQSAGARLKQVAQLKRYGYFDEKALNAVTEIYAGTDDFNEKGMALQAMKGTVTPQIRDQILADLSAEFEAGNKSGRFRYYAIEALEPMADDPTVREWLNHLAQNDPQAKLAARAAQALGGEPAPRRK